MGKIVEVSPKQRLTLCPLCGGMGGLVAAGMAVNKDNPDEKVKKVWYCQLCERYFVAHYDVTYNKEQKAKVPVGWPHPIRFLNVVEFDQKNPPTWLKPIEPIEDQKMVLQMIDQMAGMLGGGD